MIDIRDTDEPLDPSLLQIFSEQHRDLAPEPFVAATRRRVQHERRRIQRVKRGLLTLAIVIVIVASPWLIAASTRLSELLDTSFALVSDWLGTPLGVLAALIVGGIVAFGYRRRLWR
jgi:hypothetical protein